MFLSAVIPQEAVTMLKQECDVCIYLILPFSSFSSLLISLSLSSLLFSSLLLSSIFLSILQVTEWGNDDKLCTQEEFITNAKGKNGIICILDNKVDKHVIDSVGPDLKAVCSSLPLSPSSQPRHHILTSIYQNRLQP